MNWKSFRKKPIIVSAVQWDGSDDFPAEYRVGDNSTGIIGVRDGELLILTLEGIMGGSSGDWIIRGIENEFYIIRGSIFMATYEEIND